MSKCPKCKEDIEELRYDSKVDVSQDFIIGHNDYPEYSSMDDYGDHFDEKYVCPECNKTLFTDEDKAIEFLKNESS